MPRQPKASKPVSPTPILAPAPKAARKTKPRGLKPTPKKRPRTPTLRSLKAELGACEVEIKRLQSVIHDMQVQRTKTAETFGKKMHYVHHAAIKSFRERLLDLVSQFQEIKECSATAQIIAKMIQHTMSPQFIEQQSKGEVASRFDGRQSDYDQMLKQWRDSFGLSE